MTYWRTSLAAIIPFLKLDKMNIHDFFQRRLYTFDRLWFGKCILHLAIPIQICDSNEKMYYWVHVLSGSYTRCISKALNRFHTLKNQTKCSISISFIEILSILVSASGPRTLGLFEIWYLFNRYTIWLSRKKLWATKCFLENSYRSPLVMKGMDWMVVRIVWCRL